jgi:hypothetical protein
MGGGGVSGPCEEIAYPSKVDTGIGDPCGVDSRVTGQVSAHRGAQFRADRQPAVTHMRRPKRSGDIHRTLQVKFAASFVLPTPLYCATCGYEQIGRVMFTRLSLTRDAIN